MPLVNQNSIPSVTINISKHVGYYMHYETISRQDIFDYDFLLFIREQVVIAINQLKKTVLSINNLEDMKQYTEKKTYLNNQLQKLDNLINI